MIGIGITLLLALAALAAQHTYWRGGLERLNAHWQAIHDEEAGRLEDRAVLAESQRDTLRTELAKADQQLQDSTTLLTVAAAEIDRLTLGQPLRNVVPLRPKAGA